jgi:hypothetical protein
VVLHGPDISEETLLRLAIRPYPTQYVRPWTLRNGTPVTLRPNQRAECEECRDCAPRVRPVPTPGVRD